MVKAVVVKAVVVKAVVVKAVVVKARETHLDEARIRQFAATEMTFNDEENAHFERCSECRIKTIQLIRIQWMTDTANRLKPAKKSAAT